MKIYPVIHVNNTKQAVEQAQLSMGLGSDGVYLIDQGLSRGEPLIDSYNAVVERLAHSGAFVGLNLLNGGPLAAYLKIKDSFDGGRISRLPDGLWVDDALSNYGKTDSLKRVDELRNQDPRLCKIKLLGGAAFKYTPTYTDNPDLAAKEAVKIAQYVDVVTTSGEGTGSAPSPEKIKKMKLAIGDTALAIASGISADNITDYEGFVDEILLSTSVETRPYSGEFIPEKLARIISIAKQLN